MSIEYTWTVVVTFRRPRRQCLTMQINKYNNDCFTKSHLWLWSAPQFVCLLPLHNMWTNWHYTGKATTLSTWPRAHWQLYLHSYTSLTPTCILGNPLNMLTLALKDTHCISSMLAPTRTHQFPWPPQASFGSFWVFDHGDTEMCRTPLGSISKNQHPHWQTHQGETTRW